MQLISKLLLFLSFAFVQQVCGQTVAEVFSKSANAYRQSDQLYMDFEVYVIPSKGGAKELEGRGKIRKNGRSYYSSYLTDVVVDNGQHELHIDHEDQSMYYREKPTTTPKKADHLTSFQMDTLLSYSDTVILEAQTDGYWHYSIYPQYGMQAKTEIYVRKKDHLINKIVYTFPAPTEKLEYEHYQREIVYNRLKTKVSDVACFNPEKYISIHNGEVALKAAYKNYSLNTNYLSK